MGILLRAQRPDDLPYLTGGESPFDDFGPGTARTQTRPADPDAAGALTSRAAARALPRADGGASPS